jgi:SPP1 family predicted phage head-tail adaptor
MRPGRLDQVVTFERRTATPDGIGGQTYDWAPVPRDAEVWAWVVARGAREAMDQERMSAAGVYRFTVRDRCDIDETCRIIWQGEPYNVRAVHRTGGRRLYLEIDAERGVADVA